MSLFKETDLFNANRVLEGNEDLPGRIVTKIPYTPAAAAQVNTAIAADTHLKSRDSLTLSADASSVDDYYNGYIITLSKYSSLTGKQIVQTRIIEDYLGASRQVIIKDVWDAALTPQIGDSISITPPYCDKRVSINSAMQTMDYLTSVTYGKGLHFSKDLNLSSFKESAQLCDAQSNVTINYTSGVAPAIAQVYRWPATGNILWQGRVIAAAAGYAEFDLIIGKLSNGWNNWKNYAVDELVYSGTRLYKTVASGVKIADPVHVTGVVDGLEYLAAGPTLTSSTGGTALTLAFDGNPVRANKNGTRISGYSLYDCDEVNYWRYLGWDEFNQRYVTRHQTNLSIDTSLPLFENTNSLLEHYGGILRYSSGQYFLNIEEPSDTISNSDSEVRNITSDHIIGKIRLSDEGTRGAFNSLTASFPDPANKFEARNISFFNSEFLKSDRNVPKKGSISVPGITNYYNTRILADKFLNKSRFGLSISFNMSPRGLLLLAGTVIQLQYPRYGWVNKKFRISALTHQEDTTVDIVAEEYDDSFYAISKLSRQSGTTGDAGGITTTIGSPTNLVASSIDAGDEVYSGVEISWTNNPGANTRNVYTELYSSVSTSLYLTVNTIASNVLTSTIAHQLAIGEIVTAKTTINGLQVDKIYYIKDVLSTTQFSLSETKGGPIKALTNGVSLGAIIQTGNLIATLPIPTNSYVDVFGGIDSRVIKYYWVRHKIIQI